MPNSKSFVRGRRPLERCGIGLHGTVNRDRLGVGRVAHVERSKNVLLAEGAHPSRRVSERARYEVVRLIRRDRVVELGGDFRLPGQERLQCDRGSESKTLGGASHNCEKTGFGRNGM